jgi:hypothetical protein
MTSAAFLHRKWPKRHEHLVEACIRHGRALHVGDVLPELSPRSKPFISRWNPPRYPALTLVARMGGPVLRWWFVCPSCRRRCEALYVPPGVAGEEWRCRVCWGLVYAIQRYGFRHPLRRVLTARKRITRRKAARRHERVIARSAARQERWLPPAAPDPAAIEVAIAGLRRLDGALQREEDAKTGLRARIAARSQPRYNQAARENMPSAL